ncbi:RNA-binding protein [Devosia sp. ZB163]|uniref:RNA-binding protein n=1 Tax=Devosia sp. ZB163 TaxID=3025938 RepID=UPI002362772B|nr:RNA-binding protein [Devosia sp. ZB163]MDC9822552.1 RNA-binding protein [Devosia sp. ZB163]
MPSREETERMCALTREVKPVADLIRFAVSPDDEVVPDTDARAEGRGVWITLGYRQVAEAQKKKAFARSLKSEVKVPEDLAGLTRRRLEERYLSALSLARKAGQLVTGATKVKAAIEGGEISALLTATDAAEDGRNKLLGSLKGYTKAAEEAGLNPAETPHFELLDSGQMGLALGIENVIHAALTKGGAAQAAVKRAERLARYIAN